MGNAEKNREINVIKNEMITIRTATPDDVQEIDYLLQEVWGELLLVDVFMHHLFCQNVKSLLALSLIKW